MPNGVLVSNGQRDRDAFATSQASDFNDIPCDRSIVGLPMGLRSLGSTAAASRVKEFLAVTRVDAYIKLIGRLVISLQEQGV